MKTTITGVEYLKEFKAQHGVLHQFKIIYDGKSALYSSKKKDQTKFVKGQEAEFTEEKRTSKKGNEYLVIKPVYQNKAFSNYGKQLKKEQSRYSGFAVSYAKDLVVSGHLQRTEMLEFSSVLFNHMVELDKSLES